MIKLFSVKVRRTLLSAGPPWLWQGLCQPAHPPLRLWGAPTQMPFLAFARLQEKQKKDAAAAANGKAVKQVCTQRHVSPSYRARMRVPLSSRHLLPGLPASLPAPLTQPCCRACGR